MIKSRYFYFMPILIIQIWLIIEMVYNLIFSNTSQVFSISRYIVISIASILLVYSLIKRHREVEIFTKLFYIWIVWMLLNSIPYLFQEFRNYIFFKQFISGTFLLYLLIFLISADLDVVFFRQLFILIYYFTVIYIIISVAFFRYFTQDLFNGAEGYTMFASAGSILVLTLPYHSKTKRMIILLASIVAIILMMILARRNKVLYFGSVLFFSYIINFFFRTSFKFKKRTSLVKSAVLLTIFFTVILVFFSDRFDLFWNRMDEGMESREGIIDCFINDFNRTPGDWIWGRGIFGQFEGGILADEETGLRDGIENGYYETFLKGGGIFLILLSVISIASIYKGFFRSNNVLCKGLASILVVFFITMIAMNQYGLSLKSIMVYISIAACNSKILRGYSDEFLSERIGLK